MFWQIFTFEIRYRLGRPATWAYFFIFFLIGFLAVATGWSPASEKVMHNAPWTMASENIVISLFMMMVCSAVMGVPLARDIEHHTGNYLYALPITKGGYFWGRFWGSFVFVLLIGTGYNFGAITGSLVGPFFDWVPAERIGDYGIWNYFYPFFTFAVSNLFLSSTIFFALVSFTRNVRVVYSASIVLLIAYFLGNFLVQDMENHKLIKILDPFMVNTFSLETRFMTPFEKNNALVPFSHFYAWNRLIWIGLSVVLILAAYSRFSFEKFLKATAPKSKGVEKQEAAPAALPARVEQVFGARYNWPVLRELTKVEFFNIVRDNYFKAILLGGLIMLVLDTWIGNTNYGVGYHPLTIFLMDYKGYDYNLFVFIILLFYTGEAMHRDRATRFCNIGDALPVSNAILYLSKLLSLAGIALILVSIPLVVGVIIQTIKGFTQYELGIYATELYLLTFPGFLQMILLSFAIHIVVNSKFAAHGVALLIWVGLFLLRSFAEMDYNLLFYFFTPDYAWSDMNGLGHFVAPLFWFNFYWLAFGLLLASVAYLFFQRGVSGGWKERWRVARSRFRGLPVTAILVSAICWLGSGAFIYYNVSYLNNYYSASEQRQNKALYEKALKKYENLAQPKITSLNVKADIYTEEGRMELNVLAGIRNKSGEPIPELHLLDTDDRDYTVKLNGKSLDYSTPLTVPYSKFSFFRKGEKPYPYRIYKLDEAIQPGDSALLEFRITKRNRGFLNNGFSREVVYNGTFYSNLLPSFGYSQEEELESDEYRKKYGLKEKIDDLPPQDDEQGRRTLLFNDDADLVHFEATLSTSPDQIAIAPGYLQKSWEENGRRYFHYVQDTPIQLAAAVVSARYETLKDEVMIPDSQRIAIEIFYDKKHAFNLDRFKAAYADGLRYFSEVYGPFQFRQMRLMEFPRYASFAQSFANTVPYSEDFGWVADFSDPDDFDYAYFVTAHELAHQWWGHQVTPNKTRGSNLIAESLAEYTALILSEKKYGEDNMKRFLKDELDKYLRGRANEAKKENTFINCNREYQWYYKGSLILYGLRDLIGDETLNKALRAFREEFALREEPPFPGSNDLFAYLEKATPDSVKYYLNDTWKKITLYENRLESAKAKEAGNGLYDVTLRFASRKMYADSTGKETPAPMDDYIDIGIFAEETRDKAGRKQINPVYLQKHKLKPGDHTVTIRVIGKPVKAGIDPYNKLIDRIPDDNVGIVE